MGLPNINTLMETRNIIPFYFKTYRVTEKVPGSVQVLESTPDTECFTNRRLKHKEKEILVSNETPHL